MRILTLLLALVLVLSGCATLVTTSRQLVKVTTEPVSASVYVNEVSMGKTPFHIWLKRKGKYRITVKLDGYEPYEVQLNRRFNPWYIGNLGFGLVVGMIIDPITGAIYQLSPGEITGEAKTASVKKKDQEIFINLILKENPEGEKIGQLQQEGTN